MMRIQNIVPIGRRACKKRTSTPNLSLCSTSCDLKNESGRRRPERLHTDGKPLSSPASRLNLLKSKISGLENQLTKSAECLSVDIEQSKKFVERSNVNEIVPVSQFSPNELISKDNAINSSRNQQSNSDLSSRLSTENRIHPFEHWNSVFRAFIEVSISAGRYSDVLDAFHLFTEKVESGAYSNQVLAISTYHSILGCVARIGDIEELKHVWSIMVEKDAIVPDEMCYVRAFQCLGFSKSYQGPTDKKLAESIENFMLAQGYNFDGLFREGEPHFQGLDRNYLLKGIMILHPSYKPKSLLNSNTRYNIPLLEELDQRRTNNLKSQFYGLESRKTLHDLIQRQLKMENDTHVSIPSIASKSVDQDLESTKQWKLMENKWRSTLVWQIEKKLETMDMRSKDEKNHHIPVQSFLRAVSADELSEICVEFVKSILSESENADKTYSPSVHTLQKNLGYEVMSRYQLNLKTKDEKYMTKYVSAIEKYLEWTSTPDNSNSWCHREAYDRIKCQMNEGPSLDYIPSHWSLLVLIRVGRILFHMIIDKLEFSMDKRGQIVFDEKNQDRQNANGKPDKRKRDKRPILYKVPLRMRKDSRFIEEVKPHPKVAELFAKQKLNVLSFPAYHLPTLIPPLPWSSSKKGGYFLHPSPLVRVSEQVNHNYMQMLESRTQNINPIFDSINILGSTPWIVNKAILEVIVKAFQNQETYGPLLKSMGIPSEPNRINIPELNEDLKIKLKTRKLTASEKKEYEQYMKEKQTAVQEKSDCHSQWNDTLYRLSIADYFKDDVCFFPHNIDFRGRVYPLPPHFNHMGGDYVRSMFLFAEGKRLGPEGFKWLKLHTINLTGSMKKQSVSERLDYAEKILDLILDSANNPFEGERWWLDSDEPLQTLAACFEIRNAIEFAKCSNQCVDDYKCHLPIHQDGSCNGLQHYAALGRDVLGAASVNLIPADIPQDVYNEIAIIVERRRKEDEISGVEIAKVVKGFVQRKVIKQTVMTTVYGVTKYGAKLQIARQLEDLEDFPQNEREAASKYLANLTFESLNEMFYASQEIQTWFTECANTICGPLLKPVEWTTPLGLSVVQPYMKRGTYEDKKDKIQNVNAGIAVKKLTASEKVINEKPNIMKQRNGFPPNFIHSLDSSHMMLTSLYLWNLGITYASVHDCYWTHACNVKAMNKVCREQFVRLHSEPILENLSKSFENNYLKSDFDNDVDSGDNKKTLSNVDIAKAQKLFLSIPEKGNDNCGLNLNIVKKSVYFFS